MRGKRVSASSKEEASGQEDDTSIGANLGGRCELATMAMAIQLLLQSQCRSAKTRSAKTLMERNIDPIPLVLTDRKKSGVEYFSRDGEILKQRIQ